ncbi:MAG: L-histidine N(alpha)-methyltransferase [Prochlorotrichaceae cyanobacterium]
MSSPRFTLNSAIDFYDLHPAFEDSFFEVLQGLSHTPKKLSPRFLYDKRGSELFDAICEQDEYYPTRTEMKILRDHHQDITELLEDAVLIEYGSGSSQKIRILLDSAPHLSTYIAIDISKQHLYEACHALTEDYPHLHAIAVCADYMSPFTLPNVPALNHKRRVAFFPGSTIGNMHPEQSLKLLKNMATLVQPQGGVLIGVDLKKDAAILEPAYDDRQGVSADFALNGLEHLNQALGMDFNLQQFSYKAPYDPEKGRIEMQLISKVDQVVHLGEIAFPLAAGEPIITEHSYKYSVEEFQTLAIAAGFQPKGLWRDDRNLFSIHYLVAL